MKILVYIQNNDGKIAKNSIETLALAQQISNEISNAFVSAVCLNSEISAQLSDYNIDEIIQLSNAELSIYNPTFFIEAMKSIIIENSPELILRFTPLRAFVPF